MDLERMMCHKLEAMVEYVNFQIKEGQQIDQYSKIWITHPPTLYGVILQGNIIF